MQVQEVIGLALRVCKSPDPLGWLPKLWPTFGTTPKSISTLPQKGTLSKCALKGSKHALNIFRVALPHRYLA
jgi:hypothetical protein